MNSQARRGPALRLRALSVLTISAALIACGGNNDEEDAGGSDAGSGDSMTSGDAGNGPIEIVSFTASSMSISPGAVIDLEWEVRGARVVEIGTEDTTLVATFGGTGTVHTQGLFETTRFILTARAGVAMETRELTVEVTWPEPVINAF